MEHLIMENSITVELIAPSSSIWESVGHEILEIERSIFGEKSFSEEVMKSDITHPATRLVVLKDKGSIIGFVYSISEGEEGIACIADVVIKKEYQKRGLVAKLMDCLEKELKHCGYVYIITHAMVENGYADKVQKNYSSQIIESKDFISEYYGPQRYFKIRL